MFCQDWNLGHKGDCGLAVGDTQIFSTALGSIRQDRIPDPVTKGALQKLPFLDPKTHGKCRVLNVLSPKNRKDMGFKHLRNEGLSV